jgi:hypothetical protein
VPGARFWRQPTKTNAAKKTTITQKCFMAIFLSPLALLEVTLLCSAACLGFSVISMRRPPRNF